jgi:hypothetical protein
VSDRQGDNWLAHLAVYGITKTPPASSTSTPTPN